MGDIANKDEALKCLEIANEALTAGDRVRALKFARKSNELYSAAQVGVGKG